MMKYKPRSLAASVNTGNIALDLVLLAMVASARDTDYYVCGAPSCNGLIRLEKNSERPIACVKCGEQIDWVGTFTKIVKYCPTCKKEYEETANYCSSHPNKVALSSREVPIK